jgi:outer membrane protein assembly factor BamB
VALWGRGAFHSSPAVVDGVIYVGNDDNGLYAIDAASGEQRWRFAAADKIQSSPAVVDGIVYVGSYVGDYQADGTIEGGLYAIDAATGEALWRFENEYSIFSSPAVADGVVYYGSTDGGLYAVAARP